MLKYILLIIFSALSIERSLGQHVIPRPRVVKIYFQSISYETRQSIPSNVVIYDTYYHKKDSVAVPKEGIYLNVLTIDLIFRVTTTEVGYKPKGQVFYADELKDSIKIIIDPKGLSRCPIIIRPILFQQNSYTLDSTALTQLKNIKRIFLLSDDSTHRFNVQLYSHIDILEKKNTDELLENRAIAILGVLIWNNKMNISIVVMHGEHYAIANPKTEEEHARNRCVDFKVGWAHWSEEKEITTSE